MSTINREMLIKKYINPDIEKFHNSDVKIVLENLKQNILKMPSTDRPQGEWIPKHNGYWTCSECGLSFLFYAKGNYCPNCGAHMKGADDEDLIKRSDALEVAYRYCPDDDGSCSYADRDLQEMLDDIEDIPSADRPSEIIYGNEHNCIMTIFGECSYAETGCGDCAVVEKVRKALSADRPQDENPLEGIEPKSIPTTKHTFKYQRSNK